MWEKFIVWFRHFDPFWRWVAVLEIILLLLIILRFYWIASIILAGF